MSNVAKLNEMSVAELRKLAQSLNLTNYSRLRKADLIGFIEQHSDSVAGVLSVLDGNLDEQIVHIENEKNLEVADLVTVNESSSGVSEQQPGTSAKAQTGGVGSSMPDSVAFTLTSAVEAPETEIAEADLLRGMPQEISTMDVSQATEGEPEDSPVTTRSSRSSAQAEPYIERGPQLPSLTNRPVTRAMVVDPTHTHLYWQPPPGPIVHTWEVTAETETNQPDSFRVPGFGNEGELFLPVSDVIHIHLSADTGMEAVVEPLSHSGIGEPGLRAPATEAWVEVNARTGSGAPQAASAPVSGITTWESLHPDWKSPGGASDLVMGSRS
ncbi:MAG: Rho termination factor N-terminal domain-containing protein [Myxococcales bacterium]|nr:Rho termination factor N-terminal domain-containing protein [Myxococcales bacterium]